MKDFGIQFKNTHTKKTRKAYKSTQLVQISANAAHCPNIAWIPDLESQHCDPSHPKI